MKKISMLITNLAGGGAERVNLDLAYEFKKLGYEVEFVLLKFEGKFLHEAEDNFKVVNLNINRMIALPFALAKYINNSKPDAVIASMWGVTALSAFGKLLATHSIKLLLVEHSSLTNQFKNSTLLLRMYLKLSTFMAYRLADNCAGVSSGVAQDMASLALLKGRSKIKTLYNPVPLKKKPSEDEMQKVNGMWSPDCYRILTVGSFKEAKNHELLVKAFSRIAFNNNIQLMILGEGPLKGELIGLIKKLNLTEKVILPGFFNTTEAFYRSADLFVLSSNREGLPTVIIEALGCGLPVVSTNCEFGPAEILNNGEFGMLVPVGDEMALAEAMLQSLNKAHDTEKLINRAKDFSPEISASRYLKLLDL